MFVRSDQSLIQKLASILYCNGKTCIKISCCHIDFYLQRRTYYFSVRFHVLEPRHCQNSQLLNSNSHHYSCRLDHELLFKHSNNSHLWFINHFRNHFFILRAIHLCTTELVYAQFYRNRDMQHNYCVRNWGGSNYSIYRMFNELGPPDDVVFYDVFVFVNEQDLYFQND